jgi:hypothetical protein
MASTGNVFPGTGENLDRGGATDWVSPGNVVSDNATDATCNAGASGSDYLVLRNFDFSAIPLGSTINGITVRFEASEHSTGSETVSAQLQNDTGTLIGSAKTVSVAGTAKTVYTLGSVSDIWGTSAGTLTRAMVQNATFGVRIWYTTAQDVRIDYGTMAVEYTAPGSGGPKRLVVTYPVTSLLRGMVT